MKKETLMQTCWRNFVATHPELTLNSPQQPLISLIYQEKVIYSKVTMEWTIKFMQEEFARNPK